MGEEEAREPRPEASREDRARLIDSFRRPLKFLAGQAISPGAALCPFRVHLKRGRIQVGLFKPS